MISLHVLEVLRYTKKYRGSIRENSVIHENNTRRKNDLHIQLCRTSSFQKSVINTGIKLFNHLSTELKQLDDFNQFRKEVKNSYGTNHCIHLKNILITDRIN